MFRYCSGRVPGIFPEPRLYFHVYMFFAAVDVYRVLCDDISTFSQNDFFRLTQSEPTKTFDYSPVERVRNVAVTLIQFGFPKQFASYSHVSQTFKFLDGSESLWAVYGKENRKSLIVAQKVALDPPVFGSPSRERDQESDHRKRDDGECRGRGKNLTETNRGTHSMSLRSPAGRGRALLTPAKTSQRGFLQMICFQRNRLVFCNILLFHVCILLCVQMRPIKFVECDMTLPHRHSLCSNLTQMASPCTRHSKLNTSPSSMSPKIVQLLLQTTSNLGKSHKVLSLSRRPVICRSLSRTQWCSPRR